MPLLLSSHHNVEKFYLQAVKAAKQGQESKAKTSTTREEVPIPFNIPTEVVTLGVVESKEIPLKITKEELKTTDFATIVDAIDNQQMLSLPFPKVQN